MASRNERRQAAQLRLAAKSARIAKASKANDLDAIRSKANDNLNSRFERNYYPSSNIGRLANSSARFNSSGKGSGAMSSRSATQVMTKVANKPQSRYASPKELDKSLWPVVHGKK